jgi:hypothetical protein
MKREKQLQRCLAWAGMRSLYGSPLIAGAQSTNDIPPLRPPHAEIPPTFWEQHTAAVGMGGFALLAFIGLAIWLAMRPRPPVIIPPAVQARGDLESLRQLAEDGWVLSKVTQAVRRYFGAAFALPPGELTTAEFCRALAANDQVGAELSTTTSDFLRRCDERKFAPDAPPGLTGAADCALKLVAQAEHHREQLRRAAQARSDSIATS